MRDDLWDSMQGHFIDHVPEINAKLVAALAPPLPDDLSVCHNDVPVVQNGHNGSA